eukprot:COSAG05_NODE_10685_length_551_cov_52.300885_1_plen_69_part_01
MSMCRIVVVSAALMSVHRDVIDGIKSFVRLGGLKRIDGERSRQARRWSRATWTRSYCGGARTRAHQLGW